ncbi:MAG: bifunctional 4-hydroxy-2-oxoglutarate aldolase/2-dehydro-3-deoxy-phosphogluconate aldolase [Planctomycetota bacterium]
MNRETATERLCDKGVIAIVRAPASDGLVEAAGALLSGGVDCIEFTMTTPGALQVIADCRATMSDAMIGVGSVLNGEMVKEAIDAGAQFVVAPIFKGEIVSAAHAADLPCIPGASTPTEIVTATDARADMIKVFPGGHFGPAYLKAVLAPLPHLRLVPTGGGNVDNASEWIAAGAVALGVGSALVTKSALADRDFGQIRRLAERFVHAVAKARAAKEK